MDQVLVATVHFLHSVAKQCLTFKSLVHIKPSKIYCIIYLQISKAISVGFQWYPSHEIWLKLGVFSSPKVTGFFCCFINPKLEGFQHDWFPFMKLVSDLISCWIACNFSNFPEVGRKVWKIHQHSVKLVVWPYHACLNSRDLNAILMPGAWAWLLNLFMLGQS